VPEGAEGVVVRAPGSMYERGRSSNTLKFKVFLCLLLFFYILLGFVLCVTFVLFDCIVGTELSIMSDIGGMC
jgi:membrane associated rhomboid family serine protease